VIVSIYIYSTLTRSEAYSVRGREESHAKVEADQLEKVPVDEVAVEGFPNAAPEACDGESR